MKKTTASNIISHSLTVLFSLFIFNLSYGQTVDILDESSALDENPKLSFEAALKIEERDYKTLSSKYKDENRNVYYLQEAWLRWIKEQNHEIADTPKDQRDQAYNELTKFTRNRTALLKECLQTIEAGENSTRNIDASNPSEVMKFAGGVALKGVLDGLATMDFPIDIHPEEATKNMALMLKSNAGQADLAADLAQLGLSSGSSMPDFLDLQNSMPSALHQGDYDKSLKLATKALLTSQKEFPKNTDMILDALLWITKLHSTLADHETAFNHANEAVNFAQSKPDANPRKKCLSFIFLARTAFASGKEKLGQEALQSAIDLFLSKIDVGYPYTARESILVCGIMSALWEGAPYPNLGKFLQSGFENMSGPAQRLVASPEDRTVVPSEQITLDSFRVTLILAEMLFYAKDYENAAKLANSVVHAGTHLRGNVEFSKQSGIYLNALAISAMAMKSSGSNEESAGLVKKWVENYKARCTETIQGASEQQRMRFATQQHPFDFVASMEDPLAVAEISFFCKGSVLESLLNQRKVASQSADGELQNQMAMIQKLKSQLQGKGDSQSEALQKLGENERTLAENVRRSFKESDILEILKNSNFRSIPKNIPPDSAFIDFIQFSEFGSLSKGSKRYAAIVISDKGKLTFQKLAPVSEVDTLITEFRALVSKSQNTESDKKLESICRELHDKLINPFKAQLKGVKELVVCPDGNLNFVPFGAFLDENNKFLLQSRTIRYVSSGRDLLRSVSSNPSKEMLIVANPKFNGSDSTDSEPFSPLPGTKVEASAATLAMQNSGYKVDVIEQTDATEEKLKSAKSPRILHIATHGFNLSGTHGSDSDPTKRGMKVTGLVSNDKANSEIPAVILPNEPNPMFRTGLALNRANDTFSEWVKGNQPASDNDGILQAGEVPTIDLTGTWIVILSACQTGEGAAMGGEGVFGLKRGFLQAGANNLIMTLWPIADKETSEIMTDFYQKIAEGSNDPGLNLCDIQKTWMERLRAEKGTAFAINRAAPFIMTTQGKISRGPLAQK